MPAQRANDTPRLQVEDLDPIEDAEAGQTAIGGEGGVVKRPVKPYQLARASALQVVQDDGTIELGRQGPAAVGREDGEDPAGLRQIANLDRGNRAQLERSRRGTPRKGGPPWGGSDQPGRS